MVDVCVGITTVFTFCTFLVTWCSLTSHRQKDHVYWHYFHPDGCLILVFIKGQWARGCRGAVGDRKSVPSDGKKMSNTHGDEGEGAPPYPSPWGLRSDVGTKCRHSGTTSHPDTLSLAEARTDSTNPHKARETSVKQRSTAILGRHPVKISARAWAPSAWLYNGHVSAVKLWTNY